MWVPATFPVAITFKNMDASPALETWIRVWADKLTRAFDRIERCEVVVEQPHLRHRQGRRFHVRVRVAVPGTDVDISRDPGPDDAHDDPFVAVRDTFQAARRRLREHAQRLRGDVKRHAAAG